MMKNETIDNIRVENDREHETVADIAAVLRRYVLPSLAERLEAAWKRERAELIYSYDPTKAGRGRAPDGSAYALEALKRESVTDCNRSAGNAAAAKRSKYERLHECFWDQRAVQCVIRQMLDEREDLSSIDPVSASRMEYYANLLIGAASDGKSFGNAAAMHEALGEIVFDCQYAIEGISDQSDYGRSYLSRVLGKARAALSAPARNCDVGKSEAELSLRYQKETGNDLGVCSQWQMYVDWLLAPAAERKGEGDGSK